MRFRLSLVIVFVVALFKVQAAPISIAEFPFQFREGLLWIEVSVPQSDKPLHFLLDTGAGASIINLSTAKRLGMNLGHKIVVRGVNTTLPGYWQKLLFVNAGVVALPSNYVAVDLGRLSSSCEQTVDGLIGADFFCDHVVQIDFAAQKIRLLKPEKARKSDETVPLQLRPCGMRVSISVDGRKYQWMRLDTGCSTALQWVSSDVPTNVPTK